MSFFSSFLYYISFDVYVWPRMVSWCCDCCVHSAALRRSSDNVESAHARTDVVYTAFLFFIAHLFCCTSSLSMSLSLSRFSVCLFTLYDFGDVCFPLLIVVINDIVTAFLLHIIRKWKSLSSPSLLFLILIFTAVYVAVPDAAAVLSRRQVLLIMSAS